MSEQRIHELEYDLGFRDDPPPILITDELGAVIYYDPKHGVPKWKSLCTGLQPEPSPPSLSSDTSSSTLS